jgi:G:T-mismatch repair DNA endonuclease (very short patch repair protein)
VLVVWECALENQKEIEKSLKGTRVWLEKCRPRFLQIRGK